jgi:hypothetical protein
MTRTRQERPGLHGRARHDPLDNREYVIGACAKLADALLRGCASAGHPPAGTIRASRRPGLMEQLPPATQVRVRGSQIEVDHVQP